MKRRLATLIGAASFAAVPASAKADAASILAAINFERQFAGIDPITVRDDWSDACTQHARYMAENDTLTHVETPGSPLFSTDGAWAGSHAVLASNSAGFTNDPWTSAPFHEFQALHPWLSQSGIGVAGGYACMVTLGPREAPVSDEIRLITAPGFGQYHRPAEIAHEAPFVPGDEVGLPEGTKTGPHIYLYAVGPERYTTVAVQSATLTAADDGSTIPLVWVDGTSPRSGQYLDGGAILIPPAPLREGVTYALRVEASTTTGEGQKLVISRSTSFIAGPDELELAPQYRTTDTVSAASVRSEPTVTTSPRQSTVVLGKEGAPKVTFSLAWSKRGLRTRIVCTSQTVSCEGPLRVLVVRRHRRVQKLRFVARPGALRLRLRPGAAITRRVFLTKRQRHHGQVRGFAVRFGGGAPIKLPAPKR